MSLLLNNIFFKTVKSFLFSFFLFLIILEFIFQLIFFFDIKTFKKSILFFDPYCDQAYWNLEGNSLYDENKYEYHPILTIINKKNNKFFKKNKSAPTDLIFYGSSFIDHEYFIPNYDNDINFAVKSYGIDQIYKSYQLTKENFNNKTIIIGFLLEDIDRALFNQRNFPKLKYIKKNNVYELTNTPIEFKKNLKTGFHFYSFNFFKNISFLILNNFNYKKSKCKITEKKELFKYFVNEIISQSIKLNQNLIFITYNFRDEIENPNWRYQFVKNFISSKSVKHIDVLKLIKKDMDYSNFPLSKYYNKKDFHLSIYGFNLVKKEINNIILQYK